MQCAKHQIKYFHNGLKAQVLLFPFFEWENWGSENLSNLPKVRYSVICMDRMQIQVAVKKHHQQTTSTS